MWCFHRAWNELGQGWTNFLARGAYSEDNFDQGLN